MKSLSSRLRVARRAALIPQVQLAKMLDVSRSAVAQWEREGGSRPTAANLERLSAVLGCSFEWLATGRGHRHVRNRSAEQAETAVILRHFAQDAGKPKAEIEKITEPEKALTFVADGVIVKK